MLPFHSPDSLPGLTPPPGAGPQSRRGCWIAVADSVQDIKDPLQHQRKAWREDRSGRGREEEGKKEGVTKNQGGIKDEPMAFPCCLSYFLLLSTSCFLIASGTGISALLTLLALWGWVVGLQVRFNFSAQIGGRLYFLNLLHLKYSFILKILSRKPILPPFFFEIRQSCGLIGHQFSITLLDPDSTIPSFLLRLHDYKYNSPLNSL